MKVTLTIRNERTGEESATEAQFPPDEWSVLKDFVCFAAKLSSIGLFHGGRRISYNVTCRPGEDLLAEVRLPPADEIDALIHRLRPFVLNDERTQFLRVCGILNRRFMDSRVLDCRDRLRRRFGGETLYRWSFQGVVLNSDEILTKWLNAFEYHHDENKRLELQRLLHGFPNEAARAMFVELMYKKAEAVVHLHCFVRFILGQGPGERPVLTWGPDSQYKALTVARDES